MNLQSRPEDDRADDPEPGSRSALRAERGNEAGDDPMPREARKAAAVFERARRQAAKEQARLRRRRFSPLTRRILTLNVLALAIPVLGLLYLDEYREGLIQSRLTTLRTEAELISGAIATSGVVTGPLGDERLLVEATRATLRRLVDPAEARARVFDQDGALVADSFRLAGPAGIVEIETLEPPNWPADLFSRLLTGLYDWVVSIAPGGDTFPRYVEHPEQRSSDYEEVVRSLTGESAPMVRQDDEGRLLLSVAVPVQRYRQVLGALMLSVEGTDIQESVRGLRFNILAVFGVALFVTVMMSLYLASTIARPIRRLAEAAERVRRGQGRATQLPNFSRRKDEIGELSEALRDMTEALWQRMDAIERFAADVAHEIKNPLTSLRSAVETVARIEDPVQQRKLMGVILDDVQRLNRLITDISEASRVDAEMSRSEMEPIDIGAMLATLADLHEATQDGEGPRLLLDLAAHQALTVRGNDGRIVQVLRNLLNNAVSFSPPGGEIHVVCARVRDRVRITVSDQGPGIPPGKLKAIFDRFYSERPQGEKFGSHSGLGLSISKQIVEAHGGTIEAENILDADNHVRGTRFIVTLPAADDA
jgi:two-component system sensor histidine kinase ChvG